MRTNIEIDDKLMAKAMRFSETKTKKAVVEQAMRTYVRLGEQRGILALRGTVKWEGDLERSRLDETTEMVGILGAKPRRSRRSA